MASMEQGFLMALLDEKCKQVFLTLKHR
jgi:hypothetical protein